MTIVLIHFGIYSEENWKYFPLFKKCYNRLQDEFKEDTILVFNSLEEIYKKFPGFQEEFEEYQDFLISKDYSPMLVSDLIRLLLSHYLENYLYLDSDIYFYKGFRNYLMSNIKDTTKMVVLNNNSTAVCFCRKRFEYLDKFIDRTFNENYTFDSEMNKKYGLLKIPGVETITCDNHTHFHSFDYIRKNISNAILLSDEFCDVNNAYKTALENQDSIVISKNWLAFFDQVVKLYFLPQEITKDDIIISCNNFGEKSFSYKN